MKKLAVFAMLCFYVLLGLGLTTILHSPLFTTVL